MKYAYYKVGYFHDTGILGESINFCLSHDSLYLTTDPIAALTEIRRVLVPRGAFVFTVYVSANPHPASVGVRADWLSLIGAAGLGVYKVHDVTRSWRNHMFLKHRTRWRARNMLRRKLGQNAGPMLAVSAAMLGLNGHPAFLNTTSRLLIEASKTI
jgi:hypothetical protein